MTVLRWTDKWLEGTWVAFLGEVKAGMIVHRTDPDEWVWMVDDIRIRGRAHRGVVKTRASAKRAVERLWSEWIKRAGLHP